MTSTVLLPLMNLIEVGFTKSAFRKFLCCFLRPKKTPHKLTESNISNPACHLPLKDIYIGKPQSKSAPNRFMEKVMRGYVSAAEMMVKKLPIYNSTLRSLSALDPSFTNHTVVKVNLDKLGEHVMSSDEKGSYPNEVRTFVNDKKLPSQHFKLFWLLPKIDLTSGLSSHVALP